MDQKSGKAVRAVEKKKEDFYKHLLGHLPLKDRIVFESSPDMSCNTYPVYREMLDRGLNRKYEMIWMVEHPEAFANEKASNVRFEPILPATRAGYFRKHLILAQARCLIACNRYFRKYSSGQFNIYLGHGSNIKTTKGLYHGALRDNCDWMLSQAPMLDAVNETEYGVPRDRLVHLGYPRNDALFSGGAALEELLGGARYAKTVMWLPTYRQMNSGSYRDSDLGFPILRDQGDFEALDRALEELGVLLLLKLHPIQERSVLFIREMSHIRLLRDEELREKGLQLYAVLGGCDALITDYSSVYYDFLLTGRPIGLTRDDLEEYRARRGFAVDYDALIQGWPIHDREELAAFLAGVAAGEDPYRARRDGAMEQTNLWKDAGSAARVTDFIVERAGL